MRPPDRRPQQRGQPPRGGNPPREPTLDELWPQYLSGGYLDPSGNLRPEYVARDRMVQLAQAMNISWPRDSKPMHQVRRFFQHCRAIEARLRGGQTTWATESTLNFATLDRAASYAFGDSSRKIPRLFHDFIQRNVAAVRNEDDFLKGFLPHFEALVGFGTQFFRERERG